MAATDEEMPDLLLEEGNGLDLVESPDEPVVPVHTAAGPQTVAQLRAIVKQHTEPVVLAAFDAVLQVRHRAYHRVCAAA
jgi:hypothetical protein